MFELMIIDDDLQVREWLKQIIDWERFPIHLACEAADSDTARELYLLHRPKIIITDINIPMISGLDLAAELQQEDPELRFIVITGYNDFDLVRQAVNLGAVDLLSKPIFPEAINSSIEKATSYFEKERAKRSSFAVLQQLVESNLMQMQETFMANLLRQQPTNPTMVAEKMKYLQIDCPGPHYVVALLTPKSPSTGTDDLDALLLLLREMLAANLQEKDCSMFAYLDFHSRLNCIISTKLQQPDDLIEETLTRTREQMRFSADIQIFAGIGPTVDDVVQLFESRSGALTALNYQCTLGNETVTHFKNLERMETVFHTQEGIHQHLIQLFRENQLSEISAEIQSHVSALLNCGASSSRYIRNFLLEYVMGISNEALRLGLEQTDSNAAVIVRILQEETADKRIAAAVDLTSQLLDQLFIRQASSTNHLISMAQDYIRDHLRDEFLCLEKVSNHIGLSRIYFCKLFHQEVGISFNNYLKRERINQAKRLLTTTNMKVFEISDAVGFSNAKYFSYVFKQTVGQTPLEYQKQPTD